MKVQLSLIFFMVMAFFSLRSFAQDEVSEGHEKKKDVVVENKAPRKSHLILKMFSEDETSIKNPFKLRDPFKKRRKKSKGKRKPYANFLVNGRYSNLPSIESYAVDQIRIVGVLLGKERRAIAKVALSDNKLGKDTYLIKEGMTLGENKAEVKAILPGGIVLVEKIRNVYDEDEYIETIIPVFNDN